MYHHAVLDLLKHALYPLALYQMFHLCQCLHSVALCFVVLWGVMILVTGGKRNMIYTDNQHG